jgi:hypothetical protein
MAAQSGTTGTPRYSIQPGSPEDVLAILPHLLGFVPESSLVIIGAEPPHGTVKVTLRYDLPEPADPHRAADIAEHAAAVLASQRLGIAVAVGYGPDQLVTPMVEALSKATEHNGIALGDTLRAEDGRYWSYTCTRRACCPGEGTPYDTSAHPAPAAMTSGATVLASRDAVAATIAPRGGIAAESMRQATQRAYDHARQILTQAGEPDRLGDARRTLAAEGVTAVTDMITAYRAGGHYLSDYQLAWLTVALKDLRIRDNAWARMDPEYSDAHRRLWTDVVHRAQPGHVAAPASLLAFVAWQSGNGALANVALDRALADEPGYSMAKLLRQVISAGAPPSMARLPMTPEEVAACYADDDAEAPAALSRVVICGRFSLSLAEPGDRRGRGNPSILGLAGWSSGFTRGRFGRSRHQG